MGDDTETINDVWCLQDFYFTTFGGGYNLVLTRRPVIHTHPSKPDPGFTFDFAPVPIHTFKNASVWMSVDEMMMMIATSHPPPLQDHLFQLLIQDKSPLLLSVPTVQTFFSSTQPQRKRDTFALFDNNFKLSRSTVYSHPVTTYGMSIATK